MGRAKRRKERKQSATPAAKAGASKTSPAIGKRRLLCFRLVAVFVIPALLLIVLEVSLRVAGFGCSSALVERRVEGPKELLCSNQKYGWRFFRPSLSREFDTFSMAARKGDKTYRIFVLGASAAQGTPDGAYSFGRILQRLLQHARPDLDIEVVTAAMPAINSHVVRGIAKQCLSCQPDLLIVYLGNNEVVGPFGAGTVFSGFTDRLALIRLQIALKSTRLGQLITRLAEATGAGRARKEWGGLQMFMDHQVAFDDRRMAAVYSHFRQNLNDIVAAATKYDTPVILCTVATNLKDCPPFASMHDPGLSDPQLEQWQQLYDQAVQLQWDADYQGALETFNRAADIDDRYAELHFRMGLCYWLTEQFEKAKSHFVLAREYDTLRFRADTHINKIIRDVAETASKKNVYLLDAEAILARNSAQGVPGRELFWEHVHLSFHGNYILARACWEQVGSIMNSESPWDEGTVLTEQQCKHLLAYTDWDRYRLIDKVITDFYERPPFTNQLGQRERIDWARRMQQELSPENNPDQESQTKAIYSQAIAQDPNDWWLYWKQAEFFMDVQDIGAAIVSCNKAGETVPQNYEIMAKIGWMYGQLGNLTKAKECIGAALKSNPYYAVGHFNMGLCCQLDSHIKEAESHYRTAIKYMPSLGQAHCNLSALAYQRGDLREAIEIARKGVECAPAHMDLRTNLAAYLALNGQKKEAVTVLNEALELDPGNKKALELLETCRP